MNNKTGEIIERYRKEKGYTQGELAKKLGVSNTAISKWEHGYNLPDIALLEPLSKILGIDMMLLLTTENIEKEEKSTKNKRKTFITILIIILLFLSSITSVCSLLSNYYNKKIDKIKEEQIKAYKFYNDSGEFLINGYILLNNKETIVAINQLEYQNKSRKKLEEKFVSVNLYMYIDDSVILNANYENVNKVVLDLNTILNEFISVNKVKQNIEKIDSLKGTIEISFLDTTGSRTYKNIEVEIHPDI